MEKAESSTPTDMNTSRHSSENTPTNVQPTASPDADMTITSTMAANRQESSSLVAEAAVPSKEPNSEKEQKVEAGGGTHNRPPPPEPHLSEEYVPPQDAVNTDAKWIGRQAFGRNYSSTSTVYMESNIENPDRDQILFCLSTVIQAQIFEDIERAEHLAHLYQVYQREQLIIEQSKSSSVSSEWDDEDLPSTKLYEKQKEEERRKKKEEREKEKEKEKQQRQMGKEAGKEELSVTSSDDLQASKSDSLNVPATIAASVSTSAPLPPPPSTIPSLALPVPPSTTTTTEAGGPSPTSAFSRTPTLTAAAGASTTPPPASMAAAPAPYAFTTFTPTVIFHPEFDVMPNLPADHGGFLEHVPLHKATNEAANDPELLEKLMAGKVPLVDTIFRFFLHMQCAARYPVECNLIALVYLNRLTTSHKPHVLLITVKNWRMVWASLIILAQKVWDDNALRTSSFTKILPGITKLQLRNFEMELLKMLSFETGVSPSQYAAYYFEMRSLFEQIMGNNQVDWRLKPLSMRSAKILEDRCGRALALVPDKSKSRSGGGSSRSSSSSSSSSAHAGHGHSSSAASSSTAAHNQSSTATAASKKSPNNPNNNNNNSPASGGSVGTRDHTATVKTHHAHAQGHGHGHGQSKHTTTTSSPRAEGAHYTDEKGRSLPDRSRYVIS